VTERIAAIGVEMAALVVPAPYSGALGPGQVSRWVSLLRSVAEDGTS
jgi:hypothetical protein